MGGIRRGARSGHGHGSLADFTEVPDAVKRDTSSRGIAPLASDPYAAALAAQHRLHVYRRYAGNPEWAVFFAEMTATRDSYLCAARVESLDELLRDYRLVRAGDLASLLAASGAVMVDALRAPSARAIPGTDFRIADRRAVVRVAALLRTIDIEGALAAAIGTYRLAEDLRDLIKLYTDAAQRGNAMLIAFD